MSIPKFLGGFSYTQKEMNELFKFIEYKDKYSILEFGGGDSTLTLLNHFKKYTKNLLYTVYESNIHYVAAFNHSDINIVLYNEYDMALVEIDKYEYDLILIDGPNGDKRSLWYSKIKNNIKNGTILLVDDFNHYKSFSDELDKNFIYELLSFSDEPFVVNGEHSWKIVKIISSK
jgi:predicted O-methyltransferase YrrM